MLIALLRQRSERLVALLGEAQDVAHIGSWEWHIPSDEVAWSDELYRIHGLPAGGFPSSYDGLLSHVHPEDRDAVDRTLRSALDEHAPFAFEHRIVRPDGDIRILHGGGQVATDDSGKPLRVFGTAQDVTEQRRTQEQFRELVESAPDAMVIVNEQGNDPARQRAGGDGCSASTRDELVGRHVEMLVPERFRDSHPVPRRRYFDDPARGRAAGLELWGLRKDGTEFAVEISLSPLRDRGGHPGVELDPRHHRAQARRRAAAQLRARAASRDPRRRAWRRASCRAARVSTWAGTGTTCSSSTAAGSAW